MIASHECESKSSILAFDERVIKQVQEVERHTLVHIDTVQLYNFYDYIPLPDKSKWVENDTISISVANVTQEVVDYCHEYGTKVCVWIDTESGRVIENEDHYRNMMNLNVDYICTDYVIAARDFVQKETLRRQQRKVSIEVEKLKTPEKEEIETNSVANTVASSTGEYDMESECAIVPVVL